jgi:hypothetical protein
MYLIAEAYERLAKYAERTADRAARQNARM